MSAVHKFGHEAMATTFEIFLASEDEAFAASMAREAFALLDRLEEQLSRFRPHSDVSIINALEAGESVRLSIPAFDCLKLAFQISSETGGAFDVSLAPVMDRIRNDNGEIVEFGQEVLDEVFAEKREGLYLLSEGDLSIYCQATGAGIDLGGIGKGFALDQMAEFLEEWDLPQALLHGGGSTVLALDPPDGQEGWKVGFGEESGREPMVLRRAALSGSGKAVKGAHVMDPRTGMPAMNHTRTWAKAPTAAMSDALSTAFMVMSQEEVDAYCEVHPDVSAYFLA
jgi:thiamine biosynthesis lipoprotein